MRCWQNHDNDYHDNSDDDNDDKSDNAQVPKHTSLEATPAYQGLPHWEICYLSSKILHISGLIEDHDIWFHMMIMIW